MFATRKEIPVLAKPNDATFYLQRDGERTWLLEMRVIDISIYPKYFDHKNYPKGGDFALAIVEIPIEQYSDANFKKRVES